MSWVDATVVPGLFYWLVREEKVAEGAIAPLLARLPPEQYVEAARWRAGAFDSVRWPTARDAALADVAAARHPDPSGLLAATRAAIAAATDLPALSALDDALTARFDSPHRDAILAAIFSMGGRSPAEVERRIGAALQHPLRPSTYAATEAEVRYSLHLAHTHVGARQGLFAYHVHRRIPGFSAEHAAKVVAATLATGALDTDELIRAALALLDA